ncbi:MAG: hypothetical protein V3V95_00395 [Thermodesulfobacteriota bacterium]
MSGKETATQKTKKNGSNIKWFVVLLFLIIALSGAYESFTQHYMPERSIIAKLHSLGIWTSVPVLYKSSRGIWRYMGWTGSLMMLTLMLYSLRKRARRLSGLAPLRYWLRVHIFLGLMGPLLILFHSTFKFKGIVATSFWAMLVTVCFGILGRYIYGQIPRSLSGALLLDKDIDRIVEGFDRDLGAHIKGKKISELLNSLSTPLDDTKEMSPFSALAYYVINDIKNFFRVSKLRGTLRRDYDMPRKTRRETITLFKKKSALIRRRNLLSSSQKLLDYWHVVHIPLAILMFTIMFIHIAAYYVFRPVV